MGSVKEAWLDAQIERMHGAIREELGNPEADGDTPGWAEIEQRYADDFQNSFGHDLESQYDEIDEDELNWIGSRNKDDIYKSFEAGIQDLRSLSESAEGLKNDTLQKMLCVHAVTLMETFLEDALKKEMHIKGPMYMNALRNVDELKRARFTLADIESHRESITSLAISALQSITFHNVAKVERIYSAAFGNKLNAEIADISMVVELRHDLVHRNGKRVDGTEVEMDSTVAADAIDIVETFVHSINTQIENMRF